CNLPAPGKETAKFADHHQCAGAWRDVRWPARGGGRILARVGHLARPRDVRGDRLGRRDRLAASAAAIGCWRTRGVDEGRYRSAARVAGRRSEFPGPLHRTHVVLRPGPQTLNERARGLGFANEIMRYLVQGTGMMTFGASLCAASVKVLPESATPDVQCVFAPASYKPGLIRRLDDRPGITGGPWQMRPLSRGHVLVRTPDPHDQPAINPRYLAEDTDQRAIVGGLKFLRRLFAVPSLAKHVVTEKMPGPGVQTDDELLDYARQNGSTVYHASCSCMMGNHAMSV